MACLCEHHSIPAVIPSITRHANHPILTFLYGPAGAPTALLVRGWRGLGLPGAAWLAPRDAFLHPEG